MRSSNLVVVATALALTACQTRPLAIRSFESGKEGAPYALRLTQYDLALRWRVTSCGRRSAGAGERVDQIREEPFSVVVEVVAEATTVDDLSRRWLLDLKSLDGWINTTNIEVFYEGGRFKSLNAVVEDKTAETAASVLGAAAKIAPLVVRADGSTTADPCADKVQAAASAKMAVEAATRTLAKARRALAVAQARGASEADQRRARGAVDVAVQDLEAATAVLESALKAVTYEQKLRWPASGKDGSSTRLPLPREAVGRWEAQRWSADANAIAVDLQIGVLDATGHLQAPGAEDYQAMDGRVRHGRIPVRVPRPGALTATLNSAKSSSQVFRKEGAIVQSGDVIYVPVEYRWPRSTAAGFALDAAGHLTTVSHKQTNAPGEGLGKALQSAADAAKVVFPSELDKLKAENDELSARKTNAELKKALSPEAKSEAELELKAIEPELALNKAKLELLQTRAALDALGAS